MSSTQSVTGTNRMRLAPFGTHNRTLGPCFGGCLGTSESARSRGQGLCWAARLLAVPVGQSSVWRTASVPSRPHARPPSWSCTQSASWHAVSHAASSTRFLWPRCCLSVRPARCVTRSEQHRFLSPSCCLSVRPAQEVAVAAAQQDAGRRVQRRQRRPLQVVLRRQAQGPVQVGITRGVSYPTLRESKKVNTNWRWGWGVQV
jgi:hypothetical protein